MFRSYRIGTLVGFPVEVNISFLILLGLALVFWGGIAGVLLVLLAFASVLLHELGHALVARHLGVLVAGIELHIFGGAAKMASQPKTANDEVLIAAAGPAVSFALGGIGFMLGTLTGWWPLSWLGWINIMLGGFNLVPALPMDGGRILRALLTRKYDFVRSTEISIKLARGFSIAFALLGLFTSSWVFLILPVFLWFTGSAELAMARSMRDQFTYDENGYRYMYANVDVFPGDYSPYDDPYGFGSSGFGQPADLRGRGGRPFFDIHRPVRSGGFVIRQRNGRLVIELIR